MVCYFIPTFNLECEISFHHMHANVDLTDGLSANDANLLSLNLHIDACIALLYVRGLEL